MAMPLMELWPGIRARVERAPHLLILTDFDGTLAPLVDRPSVASLPAEVRGALAALAQCNDTTVAVISGRGLEDVRSRVALDGLYYAGNHGQEVVGPGCGLLCPNDEEHQRALPLLADELGCLLGAVPGAFVERKRFSLSVHYRLVAADQVREVGLIVSQCIGSSHTRFHVTTGQDVYEVRAPVDCNKGTAAAWIRDRLGVAGILTICIGDDRTDEDMFAACKDGITIKVGASHPTCAKYYVESPRAVRQLLTDLAERRAAVESARG